MERYRVPDTQRIHWVSGPVFFLNWTFSAAWNIRYPDTSLKRSVSRPVNVLIFLDLPRIMECRWRTLQFLPFIFTKIPRYGLCYPNIYSKRSRNVKILFRRMRWNSTIREVSSVFTSPKFHGTWSTRDSNTTGIPRFMKLPMLKSWQNSLIRENCNTFIDSNFWGKSNKLAWSKRSISHFQNGRQIGTWKSMCKANTRWPVDLLYCFISRPHSNV